jgi:hypothetical protein
MSNEKITNEAQNPALNKAAVELNPCGIALLKRLIRFE